MSLLGFDMDNWKLILEHVCLLKHKFSSEDNLEESVVTLAFENHYNDMSSMNNRSILLSKLNSKEFSVGDLKQI